MKSKQKIKELMRQGEHLLDYWDEIKRWKKEIGIVDWAGDPGIYNGLYHLHELLEDYERMEAQV